ncbi:error-prone DNA polymerase [Variovorax sp. W2I14]
MPDLSAKEERKRQPAKVHALPVPLRVRPTSVLPRYAELHCLTNFSFQRGASTPEELVERAYQLGYDALAITDECSVAGIVRAYVALRDLPSKLEAYERKHPDEPKIPRNPGFRLLFGSEFRFERFRLVVIANGAQGWGNLCEFITAARNTELPKGKYRVSWEGSDVASLQDCQILFVPHREPGAGIEMATLQEDLAAAKALYGGNLWLAVEMFNELDDDLWFVALMQAGEQAGVPLVAAGDVHMHGRGRKSVHDVLTAVREGKTVAECGFALQSNAERHLRLRMQLAGLYLPGMLENTLVVAERCRFDPQEIRKSYEYPLESVGNGETPAQTLVRKTWEGALEKYPLERYASGIPQSVCQQVHKELALIIQLKYEMFFLTVENIVSFAKSKGILCQGRGSSANSAVCFCLGITAINPDKGTLLFERFLSRERNEPPDIDVDFEHQRREEVIQYIYDRYGRERAAIAAVVICYRSRSALRDVGKAIGIDERLIDEFAKDHYWFDDAVLGEQLNAACKRAGVREDELKLEQWIEMTQRLKGFPRHLSQHVGGFVLTHTRLTRLVPVEKASMENRSVIQWEKDDLEAMGMLKVDVLALGMLSAIRRGLDHMNRWRGSMVQMHQIPNNDPKVFDMICDADTIGVFQIESRAQMSMLPRLKPRTYDDLVIEVAIVRPGPIQGGMVHPYLKQRERVRKGLPIVYENDDLKPALARTLGIPIFQEQVMQIAMIAAKFTADEADQLRRAMAAWKRKGGLEEFQEKLVKGMTDNGYKLEFAEAIFKQILGFGDYGFPESHAASFALLVTVSSWLKNYEPACFLAALLDSQPMGFYSPSQLVQDARRHGVEVRPVDVTHSDFDTTLEARAPDAPRMPPGTDARYAQRLGNENQPAGAARAEPHFRPLQGRCRTPAESARSIALHQHRRPRPARRTRRQGHGRARRGRCADVALGPSPPAGVGRHGAATLAGLAQGRADQRAGAAAARGARGRGDRRRLRIARPHAAPPSARAAAPVPFAHEAHERGGVARAAHRPHRARLRHRQGPAAARNGQRHHLRHAGGRDRQRQRDRLEPCHRRLARAAAEIAPARGAGHLAARRRQRRQGAASGRHRLQGFDAAHGPACAEQHQPGFPLIERAMRRMQPIVPRLAPPTTFR